MRVTSGSARANDVGAVTAAAASILPTATVLGVTGTQDPATATLSVVALKKTLALTGQFDAYVVDFESVGIRVLTISGNDQAATLTLNGLLPSSTALATVAVAASDTGLVALVVGAGSFAGCDVSHSVAMDLSDNAIADYGDLWTLLGAAAAPVGTIDISGGTNASPTEAQWDIIAKVANYGSGMTITVNAPKTINVAVDTGPYAAAAGDYVWNPASGAFEPTTATGYIIVCSDGVYYLTDLDSNNLTNSTLFGDGTWDDGEGPVSEVATSLSPF